MASSNNNSLSPYNWKDDLRRFVRMVFHFDPFWVIGVLGIVVVWILTGCKGGEEENVVVIYTSQDQVYAEPILQEFTKQSGIEVEAIYDNEAAKTVGLVNRLIAEKEHPQCDVFWNNEEFRTRQLEKMGVLREANPWEAFGVRMRKLVVNTNQLSNPNCPRTFTALTNESCRGKIALAYPLFGTTSTHFLILRQRWGEQRWEEWCRALMANKPLLVDGNSVVVKMVAAGEAWIGMTDSDDILAGQREGLPVAALELEDAAALAIPNSVGVIRNARHPENAQKLLEYLKSEGVEKKLVEVGALEKANEHAGRALGVPGEWNGAVQNQETTVAKLKEIFLR